MIQEYEDDEAIRACTTAIAKRFDDPKRMEVAAMGALNALGKW